MLINLHDILILQYEEGVELPSLISPLFEMFGNVDSSFNGDWDEICRRLYIDIPTNLMPGLTASTRWIFERTSIDCFLNSFEKQFSSSKKIKKKQKMNNPHKKTGNIKRMGGVPNEEN